MFYRKIFEEADAFVVVNGSGYLGLTVTQEIIAATSINIIDMRNLPIYFTEPPTIREIFESGSLLYNNYFQKLWNENEDLRKELKEAGLNFTETDFKLKGLGPDEAMKKLWNMELKPVKKSMTSYILFTMNYTYLWLNILTYIILD